MLQSRRRVGRRFLKVRPLVKDRNVRRLAVFDEQVEDAGVAVSQSNLCRVLEVSRMHAIKEAVVVARPLDERDILDDILEIGVVERDAASFAGHAGAQIRAYHRLNQRRDHRPGCDRLGELRLGADSNL